jgi:hypothetical protein
LASEVEGMITDIVAILLHTSDLVCRRDDRVGIPGGKGAARAEIRRPGQGETRGKPTSYPVRLVERYG